MTITDARPADWRWKRRLTAALSAFLLVGSCIVIRYFWGAERASAGPRVAPASQTAPQSARPATPAAPSQSAPAQARVVATVNNEEITREELAAECLRHYGKEVLESLANKYLIILECQRRNITVTNEEVNAEIERMASRFKLPVDQWLKMLKQERGVSPKQYANDIIWPTLALRKLGGERLQVTAEELQREYESIYGPSVKGRIIVCNTPQKAQQVLAEARANPAEFGNLAKDRSDDPSSASLKGVIQPIRRHSGNPQFESVAFSLKDGEISDVIPIGNQYVIFQREALIPSRNVPFKEVQGHLEELIRERKLRNVANDIFRELQKTAKVENVMNDPQLSRQMPGVAARINGNTVTLRELADQCIERHGEEVLEGTINRRLIEQAVKKNNITITEEDLDREIARAAAAMLRPKPDGSPDVEQWIKMVTEQQGISVEVYRRDSVWPSVALRKLVAGQVQVTEEDLQKGYEANYGPRVRCRAILMDNLRRAQQVWEMAKRRPTAEYFGELAAQYSIEATSRALKGEVPPIQKNSGQPLLEKEAFALKKGEISGIVQLEADKFVILYCEGHTVPAKVEFATVRDMLYQDILEKKTRLAMAEYFESLQENATIDNFLAGTTRSPKKAAPQATLPVKPTASR
jgi:parvulin-like peptidyl-prolyl isomerase